MADPSHSASPAAGAWTPLRNAVFRSLWIATVASNVGTWINDTTSAWLMTGMAPSPLLVSLVQAATTLPICLLAIPAGTLADILDRRRLLLVAQSWMAMAAAGLATLTALGLLTPALLLALTACLGIGAALTMPAWAATVPELVDRRELPAAIALGSLGINIARSIGPALGGVLIAALGPAFAYGLNALSFLGVIGALALWRVLWGAVATAHGVKVALLVAAAGAAAGAALAGRLPLGDSTMTDFAASAHWPQPIVAEEVPPDRGPVLVTVEYRVDLDARADFLATVRRLGRVRRRNGALRWGVFEDAAEPGLYLEAFIVASWVDHLRQHERVTVADRALEDAVRAFHHGTERPKVRHLLTGSPATAERNDDVAPLAAAAAEDPA